MSAWLKTLLKSLLALVLIFVLFILGATIYITYRKDKFLNLVNAELNKSIDGTIFIGNMHPQFFRSFPDISLGLENVTIRDKRFMQHHRTLLDAKNFDISLNTAELVKGTIRIDHVAISNAAVDLYTDSTGYSNTALFKSNSNNKNNASRRKSAARLDKFSLTNVGFKVEDQKAKKLFDFIVNDLHGRMSYPDSGWHAAFHLDATAKSMAFSTSHGSFIKNKAIEGDFVAGFNSSSRKVSILADALDIGDDPFRISAVFATAKPGTDFLFHLSADQLLWRHASSLLAENISLKLNQFDMAKPIAVNAVISGNFGGGDPYLYITAKVKNNTISIPGSELDNCSFGGVFTNNYINGKGFTDENSVIRFTGLQASYAHIPFQIDTGSIINLTNPIGRGNFHAQFPVADLNKLAGKKVAKFGNGTAIINLRYKADIVNYQINKPLLAGNITLKNADINHLAGDLSLKNTSLSLNFVGNDLVLRDCRIRTGQSVVFLNGHISNFLNLYYNSPEKILLTLHIKSPQMHLAEFIGFLSGGDNAPAPAKTGNSGNVITQLGNVFQKGNAEMHLTVDNLHYHKFLATNVHADLLASGTSMVIQQVGLQTTAGTVRLNGNIQRGRRSNQLNFSAVVSGVNMHDFFYSFDSFGLKDFTYENLKGLLSAKIALTAAINNQAVLLPLSIKGNLDVSLRNAALLNFKPLLGIGKYAFPFRDLKHITIPKLDAHFIVRGDKITIRPLQISSSVLNLDIAGTYGLINGTDLMMDVPLRNPKGDSTITDVEKLKKKRFRGIVLHLRARSDEAGKIKIGLAKKSSS